MFERIDAFPVQIGASLKNARFSKMILGTSFIALRNGRMLTHFKSYSGVTSFS